MRFFGLLVTAFVLYLIFGDEIKAWWKKFRETPEGKDAIAAAVTVAERAAVAVEKAGAAVAEAVAEAVADARVEAAEAATAARAEATAGRDAAGVPADGLRPDQRLDPEQRLLAAAGPAGVNASLFSASRHGRAVLASLVRLSGYARQYHGVTFGAADGQGGQPVSPAIEAVIRRSHQLFERIQLRGAEQQGRVAEVRYADLLDKVAKIASPTYLGDILAHPELWERPAERVAQVQATLADVEMQIIANIRQVNSATDLDFQVAMTSLAAITQNDEFTHLYTSA